MLCSFIHPSSEYLPSAGHFSWLLERQPGQELMVKSGEGQASLGHTLISVTAALSAGTLEHIGGTT